MFGPGDGTFEVLSTQTDAKVAIGGFDDQRARVLLFFPTFEASVVQHVDHVITELSRISGKSGLVVRRASEKEIVHTSAYCPGGGEIAHWGAGGKGRLFLTRFQARSAWRTDGEVPFMSRR